ncbi:unnamed protein product [Polarella glacialis]|uniref:Uncharacterized protein n=2 Tax=Polarella glacialis TaxID=89957 RepID=A0A813HK39_POLGL|nr:unnamed protein product [Polarella glacialis]
MGLAVAKLAASLGAAKVSVASRAEANVAQAVIEIKAVAAAGCEVAGYVSDATDEESLSNAFSNIGPCDYVAVNAGGGRPTTVLGSPLEQQREVWEAKYWAIVKTVRAAAPFVLPGGSFTFVGGSWSQKPMAGQVQAAAQQAAVEGLARALALELAPKEIRVNVCAMGVVRTPLWDRVVPDSEKREEVFSKKAASLPVGRVGAPEDVAEAMIMLMTNRFATGTVLNLNGGEYIS